jgi:hypothetical protein
MPLVDLSSGPLSAVGDIGFILSIGTVKGMVLSLRAYSEAIHLGQEKERWIGSSASEETF